MIRAMGKEVKRAFRMTFVDGLAAFRQGARSHSGWWADPHLRKGYLVGAPFFAVPAIYFLPAVGANIFAGAHHRLVSKNGWVPFAFLMAGALLANVVWFAVAAYSRSKALNSTTAP